MQYLRNFGRKAAAAAGLTAAAASSQAAGLDFSPITSAVDVGTIAVAVIALAAIKIGPNVAKWAGNKLANFF